MGPEDEALLTNYASFGPPGVSTKGSATPRLAPGQLWGWAFTVGNGWWALPLFNEASKQVDATSGGATGINRGDTFVIVSTHDDGPQDFLSANNRIDPWDSELSGPKQCYAIAQLRGNLVYIDHSYFKVCRLLEDS